MASLKKEPGWLERLIWWPSLLERAFVPVMAGCPRLPPAVRQSRWEERPQDWLQTLFFHKFWETSGKSLDFSFLMSRVELVSEDCSLI